MSAPMTPVPIQPTRVREGADSAGEDSLRGYVMVLFNQRRNAIGNRLHDPS